MPSRSADLKKGGDLAALGNRERIGALYRSDSRRPRLGRPSTLPALRRRLRVGLRPHRLPLQRLLREQQAPNLAGDRLLLPQQRLFRRDHLDRRRLRGRASHALRGRLVCGPPMARGPLPDHGDAALRVVSRQARAQPQLRHPRARGGNQPDVWAAPDAQGPGGLVHVGHAARLAGEGVGRLSADAVAEARRGRRTRLGRSWRRPRALGRRRHGHVAAREPRRPLWRPDADAVAMLPHRLVRARTVDQRDLPAAAVGQAATRSGLVKTSKPSGLATAIRVTPAASAVRTASAVGAEMAIRIGAPMAAVFCTISTETRLVSTTAPSRGTKSALAAAPASLSSALWRPTSSRTSAKPA